MLIEKQTDDAQITLALGLALQGTRLSYNSNSDNAVALYRQGQPLSDADRELGLRLVYGRASDSKFLRAVPVSLLITASFAFWKQLDTYKVGTVSLSESTMHTLHRTQRFTPEMFEGVIPPQILGGLNSLLAAYTTTKSTEIWHQLISSLPMGYLQKRFWSCNYAVLRAIYHDRRKHRLRDWATFCDMVETLPYSNFLIEGEG